MSGGGKRIRAHLSRFEAAAEILEQKSYEGLSRLAALGRPRNVIYEADMTATGELGEATRLAAQQMPSIVLWAFTVELCLKTLIEQEGGTAPRTHDLERLFGACPATMQTRIRATVCSRDNIGEDAFAAQLAHNKAVFEVWRYIYESPTPIQAGTRFLKCLLDAGKAEIAP